MSNNYIPTVWVGGKTVGTADVMNNIEQGIGSAHDRLDGVNEQFNTIESKIKDVAEKGTTVEVVTNTTKVIIDEKIEDGTIANLTIADKCITIEKIGYITEEATDYSSYEIVNKGTIVDGKWINTINNGAETSDFTGVYAHTSYIEVNEGDEITLYDSMPSSLVAMYDKTKTYLKGITTGVSMTTVTTYKFIIPTGVKYIIVNLQKNRGFSYDDYIIKRRRKIITKYSDDKLIVKENNLDGELLSKINCVSNESVNTTLKDGLFTYNLENGLRNWRAERQKVKAGNITNIQVLADSLGDGFGIPVADYLTKSHLSLTRKYFNDKYGNQETGLITSYFPFNDSPKYWTYTGTWTKPTTQGFAGGCMQSGANGDIATCKFKGTGVGIIFAGDSWGGTTDRECTIQIDDGVPVEFNTYSTTLTAMTKEITGLADSEHTLKITALSGKVFLCGMYPITSSGKGIRINHTGRSGARTEEFAKENILKFCIDMWSPKLTVIELGANDFLNNVTPTQYKTNMITIIDRAKMYGDVLLVGCGLISTKTGNTYTPSEYNDVLKQLVVEKNVALVDIMERWGSETNATKYGFLSDFIHLSQIGNYDISEVECSAIDS